MARSVRIQYPGAYYHVMARGNRREAIFLDDDDRRFFLAALGEACTMTGWRVHAWVLMNNHYHLFLETPEPNLVAGMQWLQNTFTRRFNVRHRAWGRLFGDRYKAVLVQPEGNYYQTLMDYIHLNPVRAGIVRPSEGGSVLDYPWSSLAGGYSLPARRRAPWLAATAGLKAFHLDDSKKGVEEMIRRLDQRAAQEDADRCGVPPVDSTVDARVSHLRKGWYWGTEAFAERMLEMLSKSLKKPKGRAYRSAAANHSHDQKQAEKWLQEGLEAATLSVAELKQLKGSDLRKAVIAKVLWERTTVSQDWLAQRLHMKSAANVSQIIKRIASDTSTAKSKSLPRELKKWVKSVKI